VAPATVAASTVEAAAPSVETSTAEAAPMEAAEAGLSSEGIGSCNTSMIEPAEGAGMHSSRHVWCVAAVKALVPGKTAAMEVGCMVEVRSARTKIIAIDDRPAVRNVGVVVEFDSPVVVPIVSPVVPTPPEPTKESNSEA
jgi:hypothetical protein